MISLSANELAVFKLCSNGPMKQVQIADAMGISQTGAMNISRGLIAKGLCWRDKDGISLSGKAHSDALNAAVKDAILPEWTLIGGNLRILLSVMRVGKPIERVAMETGLTVPSIRTYERKLRNHAITTFGDTLKLAPRSVAQIGFLESFAHGCALHLATSADATSRVTWNDGLQFIIRSDAVSAPDGFHDTGLTFITRMGIDLGLWYQTYHHSFWEWDIGVEAACVHAHLNEPDSPTALSYCILALMRTKYDRSKLMEEARYSGVEELMGKVAKAAEGMEIHDPMIAPRAEIEELAMRYGVRV